METLHGCATTEGGVTCHVECVSSEDSGGTPFTYMVGKAEFSWTDIRTQYMDEDEAIVFFGQYAVTDMIRSALECAEPEYPSDHCDGPDMENDHWQD